MASDALCLVCAHALDGLAGAASEVRRAFASSRRFLAH
jgi:hypothetical protein